MDIQLSQTINGAFIEPTSVHGILWLQTHFESNHWQSLAEGQVKIPSNDSHILFEDAISAGLNVNFINALTISDKF